MACTFTNTDSLPEYTGNTQYRIITYTGPNWFYNHDRLGLTTGSAYDRLGLYDRLGKIPLNTLEIHGTVL